MNGIVLYMYEGKVLMDIKIVPVVRNLGVYIDSNLTMKNQISNTVKYATIISGTLHSSENT